MISMLYSCDISCFLYLFVLLINFGSFLKLRKELESVDAMLGTMMGTLAKGLYVDGTFGRGGHSRSVLAW